MDKNDNNQYYYCIFCGGKLMRGSEEMTQNIYPGYDDESVLHFFKCSKCGRDYEITDPHKEEKQEYSDYWYPKEK